jgi:hypothetical protein
VSECECGRQRPWTPQSRPALEAGAKFETAARFLLLLVMHRAQRSARLAPLHRLLSLQSYHCFDKHSPAAEDVPSAPDVSPCSTCTVRSPTCRAVLVRGQSALLLRPHNLARDSRTPPTHWSRSLYRTPLPPRRCVRKAQNATLRMHGCVRRIGAFLRVNFEPRPYAQANNSLGQSAL